MLDQLRRNQKWIIWAIAIIFIAGMALMGIIGMFNPTPHVGEIYGKKITIAEFENLYRQNIDVFRMQNPDADIDEQTLKNLNDQTWNQLVSRTVMDRQLKRYRIRVKESDVLHKFRNDPPQELLQNPAFLTDGVWDNNKYLAAIAQDVNFAIALEDYIRQLLPYEKLERKIKDQVVVNVDSVRTDWLSRNEKISGRVINFDWNIMPEQEITDEDIVTYYNKNKNNYKKEATRKYSYVQIPLKPSDDDIARGKEDIDYVYNLVKNGGDFAALAKEYSHDPGSAENGGSLGYFGRGRMVPEFDELAFTLNVGEMSEPFKTDFGWHFLEVTGKREDANGQPEVEARHILIRVDPSDFTKISIKNRGEDLAEDARKMGLKNAIEGSDLELRETSELLITTEFIPGIGRYPQLVKEAFSKRLGYVPAPITAQDGSVYVLELTERKGAHIQELDLVRDVIRREIDKERRTALAIEKAREIMSNFSEDEYFDQATEAGFRIHDFNDRLITQSLPGVGMDRQLVRALFAVEPETWSPLISTDRSNYLAFISNKNTPDMETFYDDLANLTNEYRQRKEQSHYSEWYQKVLKEADAQDFRNMFYN